MSGRDAWRVAGRADERALVRQHAKAFRASALPRLRRHRADASDAGALAGDRELDPGRRDLAAAADAALSREAARHADVLGSRRRDAGSVRTRVRAFGADRTFAGPDLRHQALCRRSRRTDTCRLLHDSQGDALPGRAAAVWPRDVRQGRLWRHARTGADDAVYVGCG